MAVTALNCFLGRHRSDCGRKRPGSFATTGQGTGIVRHCDVDAELLPGLPVRGLPSEVLGCPLLRSSLRLNLPHTTATVITKAAQQ